METGKDRLISNTVRDASKIKFNELKSDMITVSLIDGI